MKKGFIISILLAAVVLAGCSTKGEIATDYFDFTRAEIIDGIEACDIGMTISVITDSEEKTEKIAAYTSTKDGFTDIEGLSSPKPINYLITYDDTTYKVSRVCFFFDRNTALADFRYLLHTKSIAEYIDPNANWDDISSTIDNGFNELDFAIYDGEKFTLHASRDDKYFNVSFTPTNNTKGE